MFEFFLRQIYQNRQIVKYVISGGTAATVDLTLLFIFVEVFGLWYIYATTIAFVLAFFVSFYLQKFWTFRDGSKKILGQMAIYFFVGVINMALNAGVMYLLVGKLGIKYLLAQIITGASIGVGSFLVYRFIIFKKKRKSLKNKESGFNEGSGRKLRILIATGIFPPDIGGPATYAKELVEELEKIGCETRVVSYGEEERLKDGSKKLFIIGRNQNILLRYFKYFWRIYRMLEWADVFYALDLMSAGLPTVTVARLKRKKLVFRTGGDFLWEKAFQKGWSDLPLVDYYKAKKNLREKVLLKFAGRILKKFDLVLFSTELQKNIYRNYYGLKEEKIRLIPNAIPYIDSREKNCLYENCIVSAGRLIRLKNIEKLIKAFSGIKNSDTKLYIFGKGPQKEKIEKAIKDCNLGDRVRIMDSVTHDELIKIMAGSMFVILPSVTEISPNLAIECLSMGKPIILTKNTGLNEEIIKNVITIDPISEDDIRKKIEYLLDGNNLEVYVEKLKAVGLGKREWSDVASDHLNIFKELMKHE